MMSKIGLVVEGESDKEFFIQCFKNKYPQFRNMQIQHAKKMKHKNTIHNRINDLRDKGCDRIFVLPDLDDESCVVNFKHSYIQQIGLGVMSDVTVVVIGKEVESWVMSAFGESNSKTKEDAKKHFDLSGKKDSLELTIVKKFIASKQNLKCKNNDSLRYFIEKLGLECK
ncbi:MAG: hypothetical protein WCW84_04865 [Sulfurimonas sp.]|jgi:hypothetical protein